LARSHGRVYRGVHATGDTNVNASSEDLIARARSHSVGDIPRRVARRTPEKVAIIDGDVTMTFAEFDAAVDRASAALRDNGFDPADRIALLAHNRWEYAVLAFATARAAVVLIPINFMLTPEEIAYILRHCGASGFMVEPELIAVAEAAIRLGGGKVTTKVALTAGQPAPPGWEDFAQWLTATTPAPSPVIADDRLVRLMYTSGTESRPRASCIPAAA
jgi:fatty-acyl-CoA synthase